MRGVIVLLILSVLLVACGTDTNVCIDDGYCSSREQLSGNDCSDCMAAPEGPFIKESFGSLLYFSQADIISVFGESTAKSLAEAYIGETDPEYALYAASITDVLNQLNSKTIVVMATFDSTSEAMAKVSSLQSEKYSGYSWNAQTIDDNQVHVALKSTENLNESLVVFQAGTSVYLIVSENNNNYNTLVTAYVIKYASETANVGVCGDSQINSGEQCDFGQYNDGTTQSQNLDGTFAAVVAPTYGQTKQVTTCTATNCQMNQQIIVGPACGDGVWQQANEQCDYGENNTGAIYSNNLGTYAEFTQPGAGQTKNAYSCNVDCTSNVEVVSKALCGDGKVEGTESCDFGSAQNTGFVKSSLVNGSYADYLAPGYGQKFAYSTCSATCEIQSQNETGNYCGDGIKQQNEACDDGDDIDTNLCTNTCQYNPDVTDQFITGIPGWGLYLEDNQNAAGVSQRTYFEGRLNDAPFEYASYAKAVDDIDDDLRVKSHVVITGFQNTESAAAYIPQFLQASIFKNENLSDTPVNTKHTYKGGRDNFLRGIGHALVNVSVSVFVADTNVYIIYTENNETFHDALVAAYVDEFASQPALGTYCVDEDKLETNQGKYVKSYTRAYAYATGLPADANINSDVCDGTNYVKESYCRGPGFNVKTLRCWAGCSDGACKATQYLFNHAGGNVARYANGWSRDIIMPELESEQRHEIENIGLAPNNGGWIMRINGVEKVVPFGISAQNSNEYYDEVGGFEFRVYHSSKAYGVYINHGRGPKAYGCSDTDTQNDVTVAGFINLDGALQDGRQEHDRCESSSQVRQVSCNVDLMLAADPFVLGEPQNCPSGTTCNQGACVSSS